jgi:hypothetical protein
LTLILVGTTAARADLINFFWQSSITPSTMRSDQGGAGIINLAPREGDAGFGNGPGKDNYAVGMAFQTPVFPLMPYTYTERPFTLALKLTDGPSGASDVLTFHGTVDGTILNAFGDVGGQGARVSFFDGLRSVTIGQDAYHLDVSGGGIWGGTDPVENMFAKIDVTPTSATPEPSALLLAGMAVLALCSTWRKNPAVPPAGLEPA